MDKIKLRKDIQEIELKLAEMKKELAEEEKQFPQKGDTYFFVTPNGELDEGKASDSNGRFQVFRTKKDAEKFYNVECAKQRIKNEIKRLNNGWTPDWTNAEQLKYYVYLFQRDDRLEKCSLYFAKNKNNCMYLKSAELVNKLIETHKQDLLLILGQ